MLVQISVNRTLVLRTAVRQNSGTGSALARDVRVSKAAKAMKDRSEARPEEKPKSPDEGAGRDVEPTQTSRPEAPPKHLPRPTRR
jgi:hypothetical protein